MAVTIDLIARMAGVSKATVSRVINGKKEGVGSATRMRVQAAVDELGYEPNLLARGVVTAKSHTFGFIFPDITNPFFSHLAKSIECYSSQNGCSVIFGNTDFMLEKERDYIGSFIAKRVDGIILTSVLGEDSCDAHDKIRRYRMPCVLVDRDVKQMNFAPQVLLDNIYAGFLACEHILQNGNRRIAYITGPIGLSTNRERLEGYSIALKQYGIPSDPGLIIHGDHTFQSGYRAVFSLLERGVSYDSVIASNDTMAFGAMKALKQLGYRIPDDVEVIGMDNIEYCDMVDPPLTTIRQPIRQMGEEAVKMLMALINGRTLDPMQVRLQPGIVVRASTKARAVPEK